MAKDKLKKLGRTELLNLLLEAEDENEKLKKQVNDLQTQLADRTIRIEKCGDIASASLALNNVFASAQAACEQYTESVKIRSEQIDEQCRAKEQACEEKCRRMEQESTEKCRQMELAAERKCRAQEEETAAHCRKLITEIKEKYDRYWSAVGDSLESSLGEGRTGSGETE